MLDLFAELAHRRVSGGTQDAHRYWSGQFPGVQTPRRPRGTVVLTLEQPPNPDGWPAGAPEAPLGMWTELAWRYCHAVPRQEGAHDPDDHPAHAA